MAKEEQPKELAEEQKPPPTKEEEAPSAEASAAEEKPKRKKAAPKRKKEEGESGEERPKKKEKPLSKLARKRNDERYFLNGKGRIVSKKKSENGKKNVQSRGIKIARKLLGLQGRMVVLGKGAEGKALIEVTRHVRECLKSGKCDEEAEAMHAEIAKKILGEEKKKEEKEA